MDSDLRQLLDRAAIQDLMVRYANATDRKDLAAMTACFVPGAAYAGSMGAPGTVEQFLAAMPAAQAVTESSTHLIGNHAITVDGDSASSECCAVVYVRSKVDGQVRETTGAYRYTDRLVRRDGWKIAGRKVVREWMRG